MDYSILKYGSMEEKGERAQLSNILGGIALADVVKSTLGPRGMDKILQSVPNPQSGRLEAITVTNDGATILKSMMIDNPASKILIDVSKTQDDEVGDGTTSVCVLSGELLREAEKLLQQSIHPQTIIQGFRLAEKVAQKALAESAEDHGKDPEAFRKDLVGIARTTLSSKVLNIDTDHFAELAVDAVLRIKVSGNLESINIIKKIGGSMNESFLADGFLLAKKIGLGQPKRIENAKILVANTAMDTDKIKIFGARVRVDSIAKLAEIEKAEKEKMKTKCQKIIDHGINCFINRQLIYNYPEELFAQANVMAIEHADFDGIERLSLVLGGEVASTFDNPEKVKLGECELIDEIMIGEDTLIRFSGCKGGEACTVVLRGASQYMLDEAERSLHDALCVVAQTLKETRTVLGAGCSEMVMAKAVDQAAKETAGKKALAMESFARALRQIPAIIADNSGLDSAELCTQLTAEHYKGHSKAGLDVYGGEVVQEVKVLESFKNKSSVVNYATEAAEMILRVDNIIRCAPRQRQGPR
uniref:CCT-beta n=1 Tax=Eutreptiella gymnastica TaxID=73025 RepID=A0A7S1HX66_9EUGL|mmetsp:Transcript_11112/g.19925  ORF Transcript_11112/g.19925 Transcript_11112/m.19925 type:complete len:530 (+) Transcript_11112:59-1648(+)